MGRSLPTESSFPSEISKGAKKLSCGESIFRQCGNIVVSAWKDNKVVNITSTLENSTEITSARRRQKDVSSINVYYPLSIAIYNKYMGGINHNDQLQGSYYVRLKCMKKYKCILMWAHVAWLNTISFDWGLRKNLSVITWQESELVVHASVHIHHPISPLPFTLLYKESLCVLSGCMLKIYKKWVSVDVHCVWWTAFPVLDRMTRWKGLFQVLARTVTFFYHSLCLVITYLVFILVYIHILGYNYESNFAYTGYCR